MGKLDSHQEVISKQEQFYHNKTFLSEKNISFSKKYVLTLRLFSEMKAKFLVEIYDEKILPDKVSSNDNNFPILS